VQDILGEIDKNEFNKKPIKELKRLVSLFYQREKGGVNMARKLKKIIPYIMFVLRFMPKKIKLIKEFVNKLDLSKVRLSQEDIYWTNIVKQYDYRGLSFGERINEYNLIKNKVGN
jgi:hypothetical protein